MTLVNKKAHWFYDEVYFQNFYFLTGMSNSEVSDYIKDVSGVEIQLKQGRIDGRCIEILNEEGEYRIFITLSESRFDKDTVCGLAHECLHAANRTFSRVGLCVDLVNDESQAYYMGWILKKCIEAMGEK